MSKPKSKKTVILILFLIFIAAVLAAVFIRVNPKWKAAELTIVQAEKKYEINSIAHTTARGLHPRTCR